MRFVTSNITIYYLHNIKTHMTLRDPNNPRLRLVFQSEYDLATGKRTNGITLAKRYLNSLENKEDFILKKERFLQVELEP